MTKQTKFQVVTPPGTPLEVVGGGIGGSGGGLSHDAIVGGQIDVTSSAEVIVAHEDPERKQLTVLNMGPEKVFLGEPGSGLSPTNAPIALLPFQSYAFDAMSGDVAAITETGNVARVAVYGGILTGSSTTPDPLPPPPPDTEIYKADPDNLFTDAAKTTHAAEGDEIAVWVGTEGHFPDLIEIPGYERLTLKKDAIGWYVQHNGARSALGFKDDVARPQPAEYLFVGVLPTIPAVQSTTPMFILSGSGNQGISIDNRIVGTTNIGYVDARMQGGMTGMLLRWPHIFDGKEHSLHVRANFKTSVIRMDGRDRQDGSFDNGPYPPGLMTGLQIGSVMGPNPYPITYRHIQITHGTRYTDEYLASLDNWIREEYGTP